jgi:hypothetical protein
MDVIIFYVFYYFRTFPFFVFTALYYSICRMLFSAAHVAGHVFQIYSHIATFLSRVATTLMQLTDYYLPFWLGRISQFPPFPFVVGKINCLVDGSLNSVYVETRTFTSCTKCSSNV